jgi:hypothetical protein
VDRLESVRKAYCAVVTRATLSSLEEHLFSNLLAYFWEINRRFTRFVDSNMDRKSPLKGTMESGSVAIDAISHQLRMWMSSDKDTEQAERPQT